MIIFYIIFVALVKDKWSKLSDGVSKKHLIWDEIAAELHTNGFRTNPNIKPGVVCSQKWNNLLKEYKTFIQLSEKTGSGADVLEHKPQFFY